MRRVAVIQNQIGVDGRSRTLVPIIELLNEHGISPDLLTFSGDQDEARFTSLSKTPLRYRRLQVRRPRWLVGDLLQEAVLPLLLRSRLRDYDLAVSSNTGVNGYDPHLEMIRIVCYPLERVPRIEARYDAPAYRAYALAASAVRRFASRLPPTGGVWTANSAFTRDAMVETYRLPPSDVHLLYPPVDTVCRPAGRRERTVVSLGGFHQDKRQEEQIELARRLPQVRFVILGSMRSRAYYERCHRAAIGLTNVELVTDAPWSRVTTELASAKVFLHTKRNEHFGMSAVEAIAAGCVPIVHESGGQRESVPYDDQRFRTLDEAEVCLQRALDGDFDDRVPILQEYIQQFSVSAFRERFTPLLETVLRTESIAA